LNGKIEFACVRVLVSKKKKRAYFWMKFILNSMSIADIHGYGGVGGCTGGHA